MCSSVQITLGEKAWFVATAYSLFGNPIAKEPGLAILSPGGVCLDSALHWWLRLLRVVPVCNSDRKRANDFQASIQSKVVGYRNP